MLKKSQYVYTDTNRLVKLVEEMYDSGDAKVLAKTTRYTFDANGNQLSEYASFVHQSDAKLRRTLKASASGDGQQTSPDPLVDKTKNTYDGLNRLVKVERIEAGIRTVAKYEYNDDDLRVKKTVRKSDNGYTPAVISYLYDRQHVILETDGNGNTTARYIRGINYVAKYTGGELSYLLYNGHGDVVQTVSTAGEVQNQYDYDIFGNPTLTIEVAACSIRYAGEYLDNETGMYYLRARYYDPNIGRFISEDSYWGEDDNPLSLNLYTYAFNNPIRFIDPTGHMTEEEMANIRRDAQISAAIKEIDKCKQTWLNEEQGAGRNQSTPTKAQTDAHDRANYLRGQLLKLETGNDDLKNLIVNDQKGVIGAWEEYRVTATARDMQNDVVFEQSKADQLYEYAKDSLISTNLKVHSAGIDDKQIKEESMTKIEKAARDFVSGQVKSFIISKLKQAWDNPNQWADNAVDNITKSIESKYLANEDSQFKKTVYKLVKYVGVRYIACEIMAVNLVKGCVELVKFINESGERHSTEEIIKSAAFSLLKANFDVKKAIGYFIEDQFGPEWEMIKNIATGVVDDFKTVFNKEKAYKFFCDPDAKPSEITEYGLSAIGAVSTALIAGKLATSAAKAGISLARKIKLKPGLVVDEGVVKTVDEVVKAAIDNYPKTRLEIHNDLISKGYTTNGPSGVKGNVVYKGPDGKQVVIKDTGEVITTQKVKIDPNDTSWNAKKYPQRQFYDGTVIPDGSHSTGQFVEPIEKAGFIPPKVGN